MSYINEALRKVQKEKESGYVAYDQIISASGGKFSRSPKSLGLIGIAIVLFLAAGIIVLLYSPADKKISATAPVQQATVVSIVPAEPQIVKEKISDPQNIAGVKRAVVEVKAKPVVADAQTLYAQAMQKQNEGKLAEAKSLYKKVIKIDPRNIQALNNLGVIYMNKKTYKWAIVRFNDALKIKPDYTDAHYNLACLYAQQNDVSRSMLYLQKAIEFNPAVRQWAKNDGDLKALAHLPEFKKLLEKQ